MQPNKSHCKSIRDRPGLASRTGGPTQVCDSSKLVGQWRTPDKKETRMEMRRITVRDSREWRLESRATIKLICMLVLGEISESRTKLRIL